MRTSAIATLVLAPLLIGGVGGAAPAGSPIPGAEQVRVVASSSAQADAVAWAVGRFRLAGLEPPAVEIAFHSSLAGCGGYLGYARAEHVDVCTELVNAMTRREILHEMAHIWMDRHVTLATRERFLRLRGLASWNAASDEWRLRGYEQGAEVMAWELGERMLTPQIPENGASAMDVAFELLTGAAPDGGRRLVDWTPEQRELATWGVDRFSAVGLVLPRLTIRFHDDPSGCHDRLGYYEDGVVDFCRTHLDVIGARTFVHELAHAWVEANVPASTRERFMALRGLTNWNDPSAEWGERGTEQAAEILAWAIADQGEGILAPTFAAHDETGLADAYRLLTSRPFPKLGPDDRWAAPSGTA